MKWLFFVLCGLLTNYMPTMNIPQTEISNSLIKAKIYLPDTEKGYYRGTRFDWSGNMPELVYNGHSYFGEWYTWYTKYSPEIHDVIMGPVEEFTALDFAETKPGDSFIKIGVGVLTKPDDQPYLFSRVYPVVNHGKWSVKKHSDKVVFTHILKDKIYAYKYDKTVKLIKDKPQLVLYHTLKNTGTKTIETSVYDHNFFMIDNQPIGPDYTIRFPFELSGTGEGIGVLAEIKDKGINFLRVVKRPETVFCGDLKGYGPDAKDYDIRIENKKSGAGVRIRCDKPFLKLNYWNCETTLCPEPYIKIKAEPGEEINWTITYEFYTF
jgi:hypothetical protein